MPFAHFVMSQLEINAPSDVSLPPRSAFSTVGAKLQASASTIPSDLPDAAAGVGDGSDSSLLLQAHSARMSGDWSSALELYDDAASSDSTGEAEAWLSICYITGLGCGKDQHLAYKHAVNSADKGCAFGLNNLGHCLENGIGCSKDIEQAVRMYERASSSGEPLAMNNLGLCLQAGNGIEKDELRAVQLFKQSAGAGSMHPPRNNRPLPPLLTPLLRQQPRPEQPRQLLLSGNRCEAKLRAGVCAI